MSREFVCIVCPNGCRLRAEQEPDGGWRISGNTCKRGAAFGLAEMTAPTRTLTTTVRTAFADTPVLPVRTAGEIPKGLLREAMAQINKVILTAPVRRGGTVMENLLGTGVDLIATAGLAGGDTERES